MKMQHMDALKSRTRGDIKVISITRNRSDTTETSSNVFAKVSKEWSFCISVNGGIFEQYL